MPIRFRKSFKIFPWFKINMSKSGISETVGTRGVHLTFGKRGVRQSIGLPGSGLSESSYIIHNENEAEHAAQPQPVQPPQVETPLVAQGSPTSKLALILAGLVGLACICLAFTLFGVNPLHRFSEWIASLHL